MMSEKNKVYTSTIVFCHSVEWRKRPFALAPIKAIVKSTELLQASFRPGVLWDEQVRLPEHEIQFLGEPRMTYNLFMKVSTKIGS